MAVPAFSAIKFICSSVPSWIPSPIIFFKDVLNPGVSTKALVVPGVLKKASDEVRFKGIVNLLTLIVNAAALAASCLASSK